MQFLRPEILFALFAIVIPIIIHLFNFRRFKKVYFTNVRFIKEVREEKKSRSRIRELLILLTRIFAITFLVFSFAQPYIPLSDTPKPESNVKTVSIYIDNSFSMEAISSEGSLINIAKQKAKEIAMAYSPSDFFQLTTNDFEGRHQHIISQEEFTDLLTEIQITPVVRKISEVITRQKDILANAKQSEKIIYLLSDFQKSIADIQYINKDTNYTVYFIPLKAAQQNNVMIDSVWFSSPILQINQSCEINVRVKNLSDKVGENIPIQLSVDGKQKAVASCNIDKNTAMDIKLSFTNTTPGWKKAMVSLQDFPITFDDNYFFSFKVAFNLPVLCINGDGENQFINAVYQSDPYFLLTNIAENQLNYSSFSKYRLIILNSLATLSSGLSYELLRFTEQGSSLIVFPHPKSELTSYNQFLTSFKVNTIMGIHEEQADITSINLESPVFDNVFDKIPQNINLPFAKNYYTFTDLSKTSLEKILTLPDAAIFTGRYSVLKGSLYIVATPLKTDYTNLPAHAIFVPMMYKIALLSIKDQEIAHTIGRDNILKAEDAQLTEDNIYKLTYATDNSQSGNVNEKKQSNMGNFEMIPEQKIINSKLMLFIHNQIKESGHYDLTGGTAVTAMDSTPVFSFNYSRNESDLNYLYTDKLEQLVASRNIEIMDVYERDLSLVVNKINKGTQLWKLCITFVLLFFAIEIILLRYLK